MVVKGVLDFFFNNAYNLFRNMQWQSIFKKIPNNLVSNSNPNIYANLSLDVQTITIFLMLYLSFYLFSNHDPIAVHSGLINPKKVQC